MTPPSGSRVTRMRTPSARRPQPDSRSLASVTSHPSVVKERKTSCSLFPVPCSLFPVPCSLFPVPCSLFPVPCSLFPVPLFPVPCSLFPVPCSLFPVPRNKTPHPACSAQVGRTSRPMESNPGRLWPPAHAPPLHRINSTTATALDEASPVRIHVSPHRRLGDRAHFCPMQAAESCWDGHAYTRGHSALLTSGNHQVTRNKKSRVSVVVGRRAWLTRHSQPCWCHAALLWIDDLWDATPGQALTQYR